MSGAFYDKSICLKRGRVDLVISSVKRENLCVRCNTEMQRTRIKECQSHPDQIRRLRAQLGPQIMLEGEWTRGIPRIQDGSHRLKLTGRCMRGGVDGEAQGADVSKSEQRGEPG